MKRLMRFLLPLCIGGSLGLGLGFAAGIFIYPFWFLRDVAAEQVTDAEGKSVVARGRFIHADPADPVHWGMGQLTLYRERDGSHLIHLGPDFEVGPGPRFHVYLVDRADVRSNADFRASQSLDLGRLRAFKGSQNYAVARDVDVGSYKSVVIWCKEFNVLISPATFTSGART
jgi:Electron transfer DM13